MDPELRSDNVDMPEFLWKNWTVLIKVDNASSLNQTNFRDTLWGHYTLVFIVITSVIILICLCGMVGNGIVIWLLSFHMKRNPYAVYILNLAVADFTYLATNTATNINLFTFLSIRLIWFTSTLEICSYLVGLSLLMAISVERCVSVLWPIWYKCHRPAHLSTIMCALIWVLFLIFWLVIIRFPYSKIGDGYIIWLITGMMSVPTFLVLLVSSLTLFIRVQCYSWQKQPSKLYWTILLNILAFLLLNVPRGVSLACNLSLCSKFIDIDILNIMTLLCVMNSAVNPVIYFFVGRHGQQRGKKPLRKVLQMALTDEDTVAEERKRAPSPQCDIPLNIRRGRSAEGPFLTF